MSSFLAQARPIERESLSRRVYRDLREMLIAGQLQPGERLTLDGVAKALGTSHMPVREAMRQLAAERVLEALPNRALRVPVMTRTRFRELLAVRKMLEGRAVEQAAVSIDEVRLGNAEGLNAAFREVIHSARPDVAALIRLNQQLHFAVYAACGNQVMIELIESLWL
ncbi:MAG TPA: GntR family transcriptional regulator, partial [Burkholderiaceae bacterium]|nr:GntR family transcriptional regulator [Burkholderiaceae bacterium]